MFKALRAWGRWLRPPARPRRRRAALPPVSTEERRRLRAAALALVPAREAAMGVQVAELRLKRMSSRWGSCNIRAKRIWLNVELIRYRPEILEYIVVHEMAHLLESSHGAKFRAIMDQHLPAWRSLRKELNKGSAEKAMALQDTV